jgi:hypothetical protein
LETQIQELSEAINQNRTDIEDYQLDLEFVTHPFSRGMQQSMGLNIPSDMIHPNFNNPPSHRNQINLKSLDNILQHGFYLFLLFGILTLFVTFGKPSFVDVNH